MFGPFRFDPIDLETRRDPFPLYARGRREHPVHTHGEGLPRRLHSVFRYADVQAILRDTGTWSNEFPPALFGAPEGSPPPSMLGTDPPAHTRLRSLVNEAFTPRIVQRLEPRMREIADDLVAAAVAKGQVDLVQALTYPLPVTIIAEIIGVPAEDREAFKGWSDEAMSDFGTGFFGGATREQLERRQLLLAEMCAYFVPLAEKRRAEPREDLLTGLVEAEHEGSRLSQLEMLSTLVVLLAAGNETTTTLIGNTVLELLAHPGEEKRLRNDPSLLPLTIEEVLRFSSPIQFDPRRARRRVEVAGVAVEEDEYVLCWLGSANRDAEVFERADVFDVGRTRNPHLAFGFGTHYCLGANLARLEARVALEALLARTRSFERVDDAPLPLHASPVFRSVTSLPLHLHPGE